MRPRQGAPALRRRRDAAGVSTPPAAVICWPFALLAPMARTPRPAGIASKRANSPARAPERVSCSRESQIVSASGTASCSARPAKRMTLTRSRSWSSARSVERLQHEDADHQHRVPRRAPDVASVGARQRRLRLRAERLSVHHGVQVFQGIARGRTPPQPLLRANKTRAVPPSAAPAATRRRETPHCRQHQRFFELSKSRRRPDRQRRRVADHVKMTVPVLSPLTSEPYRWQQAVTHPHRDAACLSRQPPVPAPDAHHASVEKRADVHLAQRPAEEFRPLRRHHLHEVGGEQLWGAVRADYLTTRRSAAACARCPPRP